MNVWKWPQLELNANKTSVLKYSITAWTIKQRKLYDNCTLKKNHSSTVSLWQWFKYDESNSQAKNLKRFVTPFPVQVFSIVHTGLKPQSISKLSISIYVGFLSKSTLLISIFILYRT